MAQSTSAVAEFQTLWVSGTSEWRRDYWSYFMSQDYKSILHSSFRRMSTEELIERKANGLLTPEGFELLDKELKARNISEEDYARILDDARKEDAVLFGLPQGITESDLASPWIRLAAHAVDHVVAVSLFILGFLISGDSSSTVFAWAGIFGYTAYYLLSDAMPKGMSLGKRLVRIRVVGLAGLNSCTFGQALKRNLIMMIPIIGFLDMFAIFGRRNQRWGDRWARTIVIKYRQPITPLLGD